MCTINITVNEELLRSYNPQLNSNEAISRWAQEQINNKLSEMKAIHEQEFVEVDINSL